MSANRDRMPLPRVLKRGQLNAKSRGQLPAADAVTREELAKHVAAARAAGLEEGRLLGVEEARAAGHAAGLEEGLAQAHEASELELNTLVDSLRAALEALERQAQEELRDVELRVVELALAVAERILACEVEEGRYDLRQTLARALELTRDKSQAVVHVHPADLDRLPAGEREGWACLADTSLDPGDVVIETPMGRVISTLADQLEAVRKAIRSGEAYA